MESLPCPICGNLSEVPSGVVKFQWGKISHNYHLGDTITWLLGSDGKPLPAFKTTSRNIIFGTIFEWNCGDSQYQNVYVFDNDPNLTEFQCSECSGKFEHIVIKIQNAKISEVFALRDSELKTKLGLVGDKSTIIVIRGDKSLWPRYDWEDAPLT